ncbi:MAG: phage holin family protein [Cyanobacteria bacterium J06632_3]
MLGFFVTTLATALSLLVVDMIVPGVGITTFLAAMLAAVSLGVVNGSIKPVLKLLSLPVTFLTLGAFSLVVNGFCFWLASLVVPGFTVTGFLGFIFGPIVLSVVSTFILGYFAKNDVENKIAGAGSKLGLGQSKSEATSEREKLEASEV